MNESVISVENVSKKFRYSEDRPTDLKSILVNALKFKFDFGTTHEFTVLKDVSFNIAKGEFVGIMGRNGAGKSTILKLISGIYHPDSGNIKVSSALAPLLELGAGFQFELSGYNNIFLNAAILGFGRKKTLQVFNDIIEFSELGEMIYLPVKKYSSGMLVRLGFSIAVHMEAEILLFDEVLAVGDVGFQRKCIEKIKTLHALGTTIILVTHSADDVNSYCSRCIVIDNHQKVYDGPPLLGTNKYLTSFDNTGPLISHLGHP